MIPFKQRLTLEEIKALNLGDKVFIWYSKDGRYVRSNENHEVIEEADGGILTSPSPGSVWDWDWSDWDEEGRCFQTGRGPAYFRAADRKED